MLRDWTQNSFKAFAGALLVVLAAALLANARFPDQEPPVVVARIEGDDISVTTAYNGQIEINHGPTAVASGSDVTVRSGGALLLLNSGGEISICGPAHFTLHKTADAITLALDYGRVHPSLDTAETFTIYTPLVVATPIAISGTRRDATLGLDQNGEMCILSDRGAMRVEPQFAGQSMIVPQGGLANLAGGQIESLRGDAASCSCNFQRAGAEPLQTLAPPANISSRELAALSHPIRPEQKKADTVSPAASPEPIYTVLMPPLSFDASSPAPPPDPSPETILLVREVRMRPTVVLRGHVNPAPVQAAPTAAFSPAPPIRDDDRPPQSQPGPGLMTRMRNLFRKLTGQSPCAGSGCQN
jgi:hypothetical protein